MDAFIIILTAALVAGSCGLLGSFLVLRKTAMIGDAISHAVLPGIVIAYLFSGSRDVLLMLLAAGFFGMLTTVVVEFLSKKIRLQNDAAIGLTFTSFFALGIILITKFSSGVDLDQDCVLYGDILFVPISASTEILGLDLPDSTWGLVAVFILNLAYVFFGFKGLSLSTFNPDYAKSIGISTAFWHYSLMALVSLSTVMAFEAVGAILVVAFFIVPPATAYLLSDKLSNMLILSLILGAFESALGYYVALYLDASVAGCIVTVAGFIFFAVFILKRLEKLFNSKNASLEFEA